MSVILNFDFQKRKQLRVPEVNYLNYTKRPNFACGKYIFPKTRGNKNKPWTHSTPVKLTCNILAHFVSLKVISSYLACETDTEFFNVLSFVNTHLTRNSPMLNSITFGTFLFCLVKKIKTLNGELTNYFEELTINIRSFLSILCPTWDGHHYY